MPKLKHLILNNSYDITKSDIKLVSLKELLNLEDLNLEFSDGFDIEGVFGNFPKLKSLKLSGAKIQSVEMKSCKNLSNLEILCLKNCYLEEIDAKMFETFSKLQVLYLDKNPLKRSNAGLFKSLNRLKTLRLEQCSLDEIDVDGFDGLTDMVILNLSHNKLKKMEVGTLDQLKKLMSLVISKVFSFNFEIYYLCLIYYLISIFFKDCFFLYIYFIFFLPMFIFLNKRHYST